MDSQVVEASYPISFREKLAQELGGHIKNRNSVVLIGMKRVGISNFLRFFLYHKDIQKTYIGDNIHHLFVTIDLNDLVEKEIYPFWTLTLKRILDASEKSSVKQSTLKEIESLFLNSIQSKNLFLTIDSIRSSIAKLIDAGFSPTLFFIRFDRMQSCATQEFFSNLEGLKSSTHHHLNFVFTTFRSLNELSVAIFKQYSV